MKDSIFVVIPAFNEEKHIVKVIKDVKKYLPNIIVVDDGSSDNTYDIAQKLEVIAVKHLVNIGKGAALKTGCQIAIEKGAKKIIFMDADNQHDYRDLPKFLEMLEKNPNCLIIGRRGFNIKMPLIRVLGNKLASYFMHSFYKIQISDILCGFRALTDKTYKILNWNSTRYSVETEMIVRAARKKIKIIEIPIKSLYLDNYKGVTLTDAILTFLNLLKWRFIDYEN